ncbi:homocysteine S-methyltransferase family protein [bacterium]|nr:homocysteine S-methyltransferase family protein [bacterium]
MDFLRRVQQGIVVFDGAMGTMLFQAGLAGGQCPELWNDTQPDRVRQVHQLYFEAGCDVVETNSFGGSSIKLHSYDLQDRAVELNRKAAQIARSAAPTDRYVAGSVGPSGQFLQPLGELSESELSESFGEQCLALAEGGVDLFCIETMMDLQEATIAVKAAKEKTGLPVIATMTFNKTPNGYFTMMGVTPADAAQQLKQAGADIIGANCGNGPNEMIELVPLFTQATDLPLLFQSNAGMPKLVDGTASYDMGPDEYAGYIPAFLEAGTRLIGGCCGTTPDHIRRIAELVRP